MKTIIKFNIWDYIDVEDINQLVDEKVKDSIINIGYDCKKIDRTGNVIAEATYDKFLR
jgi:hypothetical protein